MPRRALTLTVRAAVLLLVVTGLWSVLAMLAVRGELEAAQDDLETLRAASDAAQALPGLTSAEEDLRSAVDTLGQPGPALFSRVPVVGRTVSAVRRTAQAALAVTAGTGDVLRSVDTGSPLLVDGRVDLDRLDQVRKALEGAAAHAAPRVQALDEQSLSLVPEAIAGPARQAREELSGLPERLADAAAGVRGLRQVLGADEPVSLLVLLENNAELRATGGLVTVFAEAVAQDGRLELGAFHDVEDVADVADDARPVPAPADFRALYGRFKADTTLWKNANMSPDVPTSSQVLAAAAAATTGRSPEAVLWLDVPAIAAVLRATGPAQLPDGGSLTADEVVPRLLSTAYQQAPDTREGQAARRAELRATADAVVGRLLGGSKDVSPTALARELSRAAQGRHLAVWAADDAVQADLERAGVAGAVAGSDGDLSAVAVHNLGGGDTDGNKLDYYGRRQTSIRVTVAEGVAHVEQEVALRNTAPAAGLPVYVSGRVTPGVNNAFVTLALPDAAETVSLLRDGSVLGVEPAPAGDHAVVSDTVAIPPGATVTWLLRYRLPLRDGRYELALFPQPLAVDSGLSVHVVAADGLDLVGVEGLQPDEPGASRSGPFDVVTRVAATAEEPGRLERWREAVRRFWTEPVPLP